VLPEFWGSSDEGDLCKVDWSIKPIAGGDGEAKIPEFVIAQYDSEKNARPVLSLERSPFYPDILLTVHDFCFCIWKTSLDDFKEPIFRSANTFGSHNTCGGFSPTRPGVIFISKTDGVDVWDFYDESYKPSMPLNIATSAITFFKFQLLQGPKDKKQSQFMAYGDETEGTLFLYEVPPNLSKPFENEEETIANFWEKEIQKSRYVKDRRVTMREDWNEIQKEKDIARAMAEAMNDQAGDAEQEKEMAEEEAYEELLNMQKAKLGLITSEELEKLTAQ